MRNKMKSIVLLMVLVSVFCGFRCVPDKKAKVEKEIFVLPNDDIVDFSPSNAFGVFLGHDGKTFAYQGLRQRHEVFVINGLTVIEDKLPKKRSYWDVSISSSTIAVVYSKFDVGSHDGRSEVFVNGHRIGIYSEVIGGKGMSGILLSKDGLHFAFYARKLGSSNNWVLVRDAEEFVIHSRPHNGPTGFLKGGVLANIANDLPQGNIFYDEDRKILWAKIQDLGGGSFSLSGQHFIFFDFIRCVKPPYRYNHRLYVDGTVLVRNVGTFCLAGETLHYTVLPGVDPSIAPKERVSGDCLETGVPEVEKIHRPADWPWVRPVLLNRVDTPCFSLRANDLGNVTLCVQPFSAYESKWIVQVNGTEKEGPYNEVFESAFSKDGKHYAYVVGIGGRGFASGNSKKNAIIVDGKKVAVFSSDFTGGVYSSGIKWLNLSPNGKHVTAIIEKHKDSDIEKYVILNNTKFGPYRELGQPFFEDGHLIYLALRERSIVRVSVPLDRITQLNAKTETEKTSLFTKQ